jgi:RHH-type proline utilization regulon transcriptional repressor/proline dehydrogenase/delta 1-pyrroline-5-carboxylate dehydrogenase
MEVGNIYINRPNTGARVGIEPFGGFKMSGTGPKAGGEDYLPSFKCFPLQKRVNEIEVDNEPFESQPVPDRYPSGLTYKMRKEKAITVIETILAQYETFSETIDHESKVVLEKLAKDIVLDEYDIQNIIYDNTKIPGQISISKKDILVGGGLFITNHTRLDTRLFSMVMVNLVLGNEFNFITTTVSSKEAWDKVFEYIFASGFSFFNTGVVLSHIKDISNLMNSARFIAYNNEIALKDDFKVIFKTMSPKDAMPRIINVDRFALRLWEREQLNLFTQTRSFAINTMRHGAPLELEL